MKTPRMRWRRGAPIQLRDGSVHPVLDYGHDHGRRFVLGYCTPVNCATSRARLLARLQALDRAIVRLRVRIVRAKRETERRIFIVQAKCPTAVEPRLRRRRRRRPRRVYLPPRIDAKRLDVSTHQTIHRRRSGAVDVHFGPCMPRCRRPAAGQPPATYAPPKKRSRS